MAIENGEAGLDYILTGNADGIRVLGSLATLYGLPRLFRINGVPVTCLSPVEQMDLWRCLAGSLRLRSPESQLPLEPASDHPTTMAFYDSGRIPDVEEVLRASGLDELDALAGPGLVARYVLPPEEYRFV